MARNITTEKSTEKAGKAETIISLAALYMGMLSILLCLLSVDIYAQKIERGHAAPMPQINVAAVMQEEVSEMITATLHAAHAAGPQPQVAGAVRMSNYAQKAKATITSQHADINACLAMINEGRAAAGLQPLVWSSELAAGAQIRACEAEKKWSHTRPNGKAYYTVCDSIYAENLADGDMPYTTQEYYDAWMASPSHRANLMDPELGTIGMATYEASNGHTYWAQEFGY